jgi:hypothetical protein
MRRKLGMMVELALMFKPAQLGEHIVDRVTMINMETIIMVE